MSRLAWLTFFSGLVYSSLFYSALVTAEPAELYWEDLVPTDYVEPQIQLDHANPMAQQNLEAPLVTKFNNKRVKIPGFIVPIEGDMNTVTEFLLVPYFGACIHVPPPPPNQIVYVKFPNGVPIGSITDAVWVTGDLSTEGWKGEIATVGYSLQGVEIQPFEG